MRVIQRKLREAGLYITAEQAIKEPDRVRAIHVKTDKTEVYARTAIQGESNQILRASEVKIPPVVLKENSVVQ